MEPKVVEDACVDAPADDWLELNNPGGAPKFNAERRGVAGVRDDDGCFMRDIMDRCVASLGGRDVVA